MTRMSARHQPLMESLESRQVLSSGGPSADAQYMLELINAARTNPGATIDRLTAKLDDQTIRTLDYYKVDLQSEKQAISSLGSREPLAWNGQLAGAASSHSQDQAANGFQSHTGSDGSSSSDRIARTGFDAKASSENAYAYADSVDDAMRAFLIDWGVDSKGHRNNLLQSNPSEASYDQIGIGIAKSSKNGLGPLVVTQEMARSDDKAQLLGVVYDDKNGNDFYSVGEGVADVTIKATNVASGETSQVKTWDSGGYQLPLDPGNYQISASEGSTLIGSKAVQIQSSNVKVDFQVDHSSDDSSAPTSNDTPKWSVPSVGIAPLVMPAKSNSSPSRPSTSRPVTIAPLKTSTSAPQNSVTNIQPTQPVIIPAVKPTEVAAVKPVILKDSSPPTNAPQSSSNDASVGFDPSWITSWSNWKATSKSKS